MKKIKVFYAVQVSNFTHDKDGEPKWLLRNDACTNIAIGIVSTILERYPNQFEFLIKLPPDGDTIDVNELRELFKEKYMKDIRFLRDSIPHSPITSRFNFDFIKYVHCKEEFEDVDVMINDENTLTKNWRVLFDYLKLNIPIISTNYFMDSPISPKSDIKVRYYERQMESLMSSDMFSYPVQSALDEALKAYDFMFRDRKWLAQSTVWNIGAYYEEISKGHVSKRTDKIQIYFGNRITDSAGRYTNWHLFAEAIGKLSKIIDPNLFEAVMLNPTKKVTNEQLNEIKKLSNDLVRVIPNDSDFSREDYIKFINESHISCNLFTNEVHGGLTHVEAMMAGNILIAPDINDYRHKYEDSNRLDYPFLIKTVNKEIDKEHFVECLKEAVLISLSSGIKQWSELNKELAYKYASYENSSDIIVKDLKLLIEKCKNK